ncbi:hypothetical protein ACEWY4_004962 [Coilia grayii]|uniref:Kindlin-2 N-terminal domain-containing protein n=1 Tax=Coilia grayii TaxID=363190 RepID=A0ABD1KH12_9TELE
MALDGIRMPDGCYADGTWELKMHVTDLHKDVSLRVTGEIHIGGVMLKLVEELGGVVGVKALPAYSTAHSSDDTLLLPLKLKHPIT